MSDIVIQVENLSKFYRLGVINTGTVSHDLNRWWARFRGKPDPALRAGHVPKKESSVSKDSNNEGSIWALRDINFEVTQGEVLGIIGRNGAGKSTLLKILSRVTAPTTGECRVKGQIASLLEVGTGFHPELTGRENIYLNGAILGMTKGEIGTKFDEIVGFSEVEKYIDTPVKHYSSGMYVRLAFAVAAHLDPEILIVDEVLAVGDAAFQDRCIKKMGSFGREGRTVLFVSHNMRAIDSLCSRAILLDDGTVKISGDVAKVIESYIIGQAEENIYAPLDNGEDFLLKEIRLENSSGEGRSKFFYSEEINIKMWFLSRTSGKWPRAGITLRDQMGDVVFSSGYKDLGVIGGYCGHGSIAFKVNIPSSLLNIGRYSLDASAHYPNVQTVFYHRSCIGFSIEEDRQVPGGYGYDRKGMLRPRLQWDLLEVGHDL